MNEVRPPATGDDVLIVDDDLAGLKLLTLVIEAAGHSVRAARDGELALRAIRARPPSLVLLDIRLPGIDGYEILRRLRADDATASIPVIFVTGVTDAAERVRGLHAGAADYVIKPYHKEEVLARVETHLSLRRARMALDRERVLLAAEIEQHRRTEEALRASEEVFRTFFDHAPIGKSMTSPNGALLHVNQAFCNMLGRTPEEMQRLSFVEITHPDDVAESRECIRALIAHERDVWTMTKRYAHADGHYVTAHVTTRMLRDADGNPRHLVTHILDLTDLRKAEAALQESQERIRATLYGVGDGVIACDASGDVQVMNPVAEALTGWKESEAKGRPIDGVFKIFNEENRAVVESPVQKVLREGVIVGLANHTLLVARDGTERPIADSGAPIRSPQGTVTGVVLVFRDQTDERRRQRELALLNAMLASIRNVNQIIVRERDPGRLIRQACDALVEAGSFGCSWALLTDDSGGVQSTASAGFALDGDPAALCARGIKPGCLAVQAAEGVVHGEALKALCQGCPMADAHSPVARMVVGISQSGRRRGVLGVGFKGSTAVTEEQCSLLLELAGDIDFALESIEQENRRKQAEQSVRVAEERMRAILSHLPAGIVVVDNNERVEYVNPAFATAFELPEPPDAYAGVGASQFLSAVLPQYSDPGSAGQLVRKLVTQGEAHFGEEVSLRNGRVELVDYVPLPQGRMWVHHDITERKHAETALRQSEEMLRAVIDASPFPVALVDRADDNIVYWSRSAKELFGHTPSTTPEWYACAYPDPDYRREVLDRWKGLLAAAKDSSRTVNTGEYQVTTKDGSVRTCQIYATFVANNLVVTFNDVTDHKRADEERLVLQANLAQSDRLSSMGMLAAGVAHEINNPLAYVLYNLESLCEDIPKQMKVMRRCCEELQSRVGFEGMTQLLGDEQAAFNPTAFEDVRERLKDALSGTQKIKGITRSLGTFARVEQDDLVPVNVHASVEHAITLAYNELKYRACLVKQLSKVPAVLATEGKLAQVFLNLIINAAHAIGEGHVDENEVRVRTWSEGDGVFVEVCDTGRGISPEHQARIFDPFFSTKGVGIGSGLGLSISKSIIGQFGGDITFSSEVGTGTRFVVRLPRLPSDWEDRRSTRPAIRPAEQQPIRGRILIVDDEPGIRSAIERMLKAQHEVISTCSGAEAQRLLRKDRAFDVVYCDLMMPEMSGMELYNWLVGEDADLARQVVFVTAGGFTPEASAFLAKVGNLRVQKPFESAAFTSMTADLVRAARAKDAGG